ncbi:PTS sugar transporter subunit IIA [Aureibacillus halotolerans]|uniref:PTS system IIA component (L-Asc family) n=1 Tax=Aureibacillus halotolerans TaxID=1508390 RepID=A0A4R6U8B9_9BACI|nr:PTS sugar transporter subunit IIA [Aureibacillus halotolerans]TDQ42798.1 PTS system IIA component (L-Asc family) [Aureibacillus halotolerans]
MKFLHRSLVSLTGQATTPEDAIQEAGELLVSEGSVQQGYVDAMVRSFKKNGPYIVLAPQIAVPHARPEDGAHESSISLVRYENGVVFGHTSNDPVKLVFALGATSSEEHLELLKRLTTLLSKEANVVKLLNATSYEDIEQILGGTTI